MNKDYLNAFSKPIVTFRQWGRKGYSIFTTLNKVVAIAFLAISYHVSAETLVSPVPVDTTQVVFELDLDEIEVNAQRVPVTYSQVARIVSVIERAEIEKAPVESIQELLEFLPGVDVRKRGGEGVQADIGIRGGSFDQLLILLNGINITDPQTGHHNLNLPVSLQQIQRIEVLQGSASRVFGANAFSGAINIITHQPDGNEASISASAGNFGYRNLDVSGALDKGAVKHYLAANAKKSDGYIDNTDFERSNLFYQLNAGFTKHKLAFQAGFTDKGFGANSFYTPVYPKQYEEVKTYLTSLKWQSMSKFHVSSSVYWRRHYDRFELFRNEAPSWYKSHNYHRTDAAGANLNSWVETVFGKSAFGVEYRLEHIKSNVLGEPLDKPIDVNGADAQYLFSDSRNIYSAYFEQSYHSSNWSIAAGIMANKISGSNEEINFFPGMDISFSPLKQIGLYASISKSLRMPTFTDLYYSGPTNMGNPNLEPETTSSIEGGLKLKGKDIFGNITVYHSSAKNVIDWVRLVSEDKWHTENLTKLKRAGIGFNFHYINNGYSGNPIERIVIGYQYNTLDVNENNYISNYTLDNLKHKFTATLAHKIIGKLSASWTLVFQDRNGAYTEYLDDSYGSEKEYKPFALLNGKIVYQHPFFNVFVSASNLLDKKYFDIGNVRQPGIWIKTGLGITIK